MSRAYRVVLPSFIFASLGIIACRTEEDGSGGAGATSGSTTGSKGTTTSTMTTTTGSNTTSTMSSGTGGQVGCSGDEHTVQELSDGTIGAGIKVTVKGAVAMSKKFLVSGSNSCLWGVYISAPGLTETAPNSGIVALSYGTPPMIPPGGNTAFCPKQGQTPDLDAGDKIPNDVAPGDVLDLVGVTATFPTMINCKADEPQNTVPQHQLAQVCSVTKTGTAPVPAPHKLTAAELMGVGSTTDKDFHDKWAGVWVEADNLTPVGPMTVGMYGVIDTTQNVQLRSKIFYRGYAGSDACHTSWEYATTEPFTSVKGFHSLSFCDWGIEVNDKCGDIVPNSDDCTAMTCAGVP